MSSLLEARPLSKFYYRDANFVIETAKRRLYSFAWHFLTVYGELPWPRTEPNLSVLHEGPICVYNMKAGSVNNICNLAIGRNPTIIVLLVGIS